MFSKQQLYRKTPVEMYAYSHLNGTFVNDIRNTIESKRRGIPPKEKGIPPKNIVSLVK